jgi:hypothetical protein
MKTQDVVVKSISASDTMKALKTCPQIVQDYVKSRNKLYSSLQDMVRKLMHKEHLKYGCINTKCAKWCEQYENNCTNSECGYTGKIELPIKSSFKGRTFFTTSDGGVEFVDPRTASILWAELMRTALEFKNKTGLDLDSVSFEHAEGFKCRDLIQCKIKILDRIKHVKK